jgi:hypothetical protein
LLLRLRRLSRLICDCSSHGYSPFRFRTNKNPPPFGFWRWVSPCFELFELAQQVTSARRRVIRLALATVAGLVIRVFGIIEVMVY